MDITLLPEFRGCGIGQELLTRVQRKAASDGRVVSLEVEVHSRAVALYERLGCVPVAEHGVRRLMECRAARARRTTAGQAKTAS